MTAKNAGLKCGLYISFLNSFLSRLILFCGEKQFGEVKCGKISSTLQAAGVWHLLNRLHHEPVIALWIMTPSVIPSGDNGPH